MRILALTVTCQRRRVQALQHARATHYAHISTLADSRAKGGGVLADRAWGMREHGKGSRLSRRQE